ncbi:MAG: nodulation protein NfeD [candidate division WOR-3 bacterium]
MTKSKVICLITATLLFYSFVASASETNNNYVYILKFTGPIGPISADYIISGIEQAEKDNAIGIIIKLDTPGGLDDSMREIIQKIFNAKIPVVIYIYPSGARAASAGVFITLAGNIAVMASGTNIGAAHPVSIGGKEIPQEMKEKVVNDAVSYIISIAEKRNRNKKWAEQAVRQSVAISANEAIKLNVVDFIADHDTELYQKLDSIAIVNNKKLPVAGWQTAIKKELTMNARQKFLLFLTNPNIAYILLMLGIYGLIFELQSPGAIFPGAIGAICLILGTYSLHLLPTNYAGLALIGFAIILFILEIYITSYGLLTIGGIITLILGSILLFQSPAPYFRLAKPVLIITIIVTALFFIWIISLAIKAHQKKVTTGKEGLIAATGVAQTDLAPEGTILIHGELWTALSVEDKIKKGEKVIVVAIDGMKLHVKKQT